jgi:hypothetical protein
MLVHLWSTSGFNAYYLMEFSRNCFPMYDPVWETKIWKITHADITPRQQNKQSAEISNFKKQSKILWWGRKCTTLGNSVRVTLFALACFFINPHDLVCLYIPLYHEVGSNPSVLSNLNSRHEKRIYSRFYLIAQYCT